MLLQISSNVRHQIIHLRRRLAIRIWALALIAFVPSFLHAQLKPEELGRDFLVKLMMKDSSQFYAVVLAKPLPDRIIAETRNGRLEIPLRDIDWALDYRFNYVMKDDILSRSTKNSVDDQKYEVTRFLSRPKLPDISTVYTKDHDIFKGHRYLFDDTAHVILATLYGNLFFKYPALDKVENFSGDSDTRETFYTTTYLTANDPLASQGFLTPTARSFGDSNSFISDYLLAGLQFNYGATNWLSVNAGGLFGFFLPTQVITATGGVKITPYQSGLWAVAVGGQGVYTQVVNITRIAFPYAVATYGTWEGGLSVLGGMAYQWKTDTVTHQPYHLTNSVIAFEGDMRVGENIKAGLEFFFISDFNIVPVCAWLRYFQNNLTVNAGVVFSLYKSGAARTTPTLGQYVFNTNFDIIPLVSATFHF